MAVKTKTCPGCQVPLQHAGATFELTRRQMPEVAGRTPLPVIPYWCPKCGYMQLYLAQVAGSLYG